MAGSSAAWLARRAYLLLVDTPADPSPARAAGCHGVVLHPSDLGVVGDPGDLVVASVVGYPTGRHHTLVKAAEARLAVAHGATEVWLCPDPTRTDGNALLAEFVAVREAVPPPVTLAVVLTAPRPEVAAAAARAGADRLVWWGAGEAPRDLPLPYLAVARDLEGVIDALDGGADRVGVSDVAAVSPSPH